ncbi:MAG TPA: hypothetical protein GXZ30_04345 [Propionibacterium sp.]|nr:hypothetical protein [Propionibacterium sp.]
MSSPNGSSPWPSGTGPDPADPGVPGTEPSEPVEEQPGLVNEPVQRTAVPMKIMIGSLIALLVTVGVVAFITTRTTGVVAPPAPSTPEPTGAPVLPLRTGDYAREPGDVTAPLDFGVDRSIQTSSARYLRNGEPALIAVGARPVEDPKALFDQIKVRAQRQVGEGWCGREDTNDLDVCIAKHGRTAVLAIGLRDQTPEEIMLITQQILAETV